MKVNIFRGVLVALTVVLIGIAGNVYGQDKAGASASGGGKAQGTSPLHSGAAPAIIRRGDTSGVGRNDVSTGIAPRGDPFGISPKDPFPISQVDAGPAPGFLGPPIPAPAQKKKTEPSPGVVNKPTKTKTPQPGLQPAKKPQSGLQPSKNPRPGLEPSKKPLPQTDPITWDSH